MADSDTSRPDDRQSIEELNPDELVTSFSRSRVTRYVLIALAAHVVVLLLTSITYVRDTWIDPEGAAARKALAAQQGDEGPDDAPAATQPAGAQPTTGVSPDVVSGGQPTTAQMESDVYKSVTDTAEEDEIPDAPLLNLDETN